MFEATQALPLELAAAGVADGLRIDHPDGLRDPAQYFRRLQHGYARRAGIVLPEAPGDQRPARPLYLVAEKITASHEDVPEAWPVHGTTGYRFAIAAQRRSSWTPTWRRSSTASGAASRTTPSRSTTTRTAASVP